MQNKFFKSLWSDMNFVRAAVCAGKTLLFRKKDNENRERKGEFLG